MPVYPAAIKRLIPPGSNDPRITPRVAILHVADMLGPSLYDYFAHRSGGIESHFYIRLDGTVEQYRDTNYQADANLDANDFAVSIETEGKGDGEWTTKQLDAIKALLTWLHNTHDIPWHKIQHWDGSGFGYHTLFGAPSHWTPVAKSCPGPKRIVQFDKVLVPWIDAQGRGVPSADRAPAPKPAPVEQPRKAPKPRTARGGYWNMERDRDKNKAALAALKILVSNDLDWLALGESSDYLHQLAALPGARLVAFHGNGQGETCILVRDRTKASGVACKLLTLLGWITVRGGHTPPKYLTTAVLNGLEVGAGHTPPTVDWRNGQAVGPARRVATFLGWAGGAVRWLRGRKGPAILLADMNEPPTSRGHGSPHWIARMAGGSVVAPAAPTHGHEVIDFGIAVNCQATATTGTKDGSDHNFVLFEITY